MSPVRRRNLPEKALLLPGTTAIRGCILLYINGKNIWNG